MKDSFDILLLGASGSIGRQTIALCQQETDFHIVSVSLYSDVDTLEPLLNSLPYLKNIGIVDNEKGEGFKARHPKYNYYFGINCNLELIQKTEFDKVVNALVGAIGFLPSLFTLRKNKDLCLANKESLVIGGEFLKKEIKLGNGRLFPIDSEHVALSKLLKNVNRSEVKRLIITASGGSLREVKKEDLSKVTLKKILNHPTWKMGTRITVDSATMVNKGFEFIEASYLYDWDIDNISVLINDESEVHSAIEMKDNSYLFEVGPSDMTIPISYALNETRRVEASYKVIDFDRKCSLNFRKFDKSRYPLFNLVLKTYKLGGTAMAFLNAVDEEAIRLLEKGKINYVQMIRLITDLVSDKMINKPNPNEYDILKVDSRARELVLSSLL